MKFHLLYKKKLYSKESKNVGKNFKIPLQINVLCDFEKVVKVIQAWLK